MQKALRSSGNQAYLTREEASNILNRKDPNRVRYNPYLIGQLDKDRSKLDKDYFALLDCIDNNEQLKIRSRFFQFDDTLIKYLNKNRNELYAFLEQHYKNDDEKAEVIKTNCAALDEVRELVSNILINYISPSASYDDNFRRELHAIWTIIKGRYYRERMVLYPLYPALAESDWRDSDWLRIYFQK